VVKTRTLLVVSVLLFFSLLFIAPKHAAASSYDGYDMAMAVLANQSTYISSSYTDTDTTGQFRQRAILSSLGTMYPTHGDTFVLLSTGVAGSSPATSNAQDPGSERGTWFGKKWPGWGDPFDRATFTLTLKVPPGAHNVSYDIQFFSMEYPDYVGSVYNDKLVVTVNSPSCGVSTYIFDVNRGDFVLESPDIPGTGFDVYSVRWVWWKGEWLPTSPSGVDTVTTTPYDRRYSDAGASALITRQHPVAPNETITITFDLSDKGDNQFDTTVFLDNIRFTGYGVPTIRALKTWQDENGSRSILHPGDTIHYSITISNSGSTAQFNNPGNEFEDIIPDNTTYVSGSLYASSGTASYDAGENKITWNGVIPAESSVFISYDVQVDPTLSSTTIISNQGTVFWDSDGDNTNDAVELTDDPTTDDGIDSDGDGDTADDDPTIATVLVYNLSELVEDFSDDTPGEAASQDYYDLDWFSTSKASSGKSIFEVAGGYYYRTPNSFKIQLRSTDSPHYWNYTLNWISQQLPLKYWQINFTCGNNSEDADLIISIKNSTGADIAKLKFDYVPTGADTPNNYAPLLYYMNSEGAWVSLTSDFNGGYLFNGWYSLTIRQFDNNYLNYTLYRVGAGITDIKRDNMLNAPLTELSQVVWSTTKNPVVAPIFFWDEHTIGFT